MELLTELHAGGRPISQAELNHLAGVFKREREMELVLQRERHRRMRRAAERMGELHSLEGLGAPVIECDQWVASYLEATLGRHWYKDKTALRMLKAELPEMFHKPKGTNKIQVGCNG